MKAMIFAAGLGTRLKPLTDTKPKALVEVDGITLLELSIRRLLKYGFEDILINVHHFAEQVIDFLESHRFFGARVVFSDERRELLETGGGLRKAAWFFEDTEAFLVCNVDILSTISLSDFYQSHCQSDALATLAVRHRHSSRYLLFDKEHRLWGWRHARTGEIKKAPQAPRLLEDLAFSGLHVLSPQIFNLMWREGHFSIIDSYLDLAAHHPIQGYLHDESIWLDVGKPTALSQAAALLKRIDF